MQLPTYSELCPDGRYKETINGKIEVADMWVPIRPQSNGNKWVQVANRDGGVCNPLSTYHGSDGGWMDSSNGHGWKGIFMCTPGTAPTFGTGKYPAGKYRLLTMGGPEDDGAMRPNWSLSSLRGHGLDRNHASSRVMTHSGKDWGTVWDIQRSPRTHGKWQLRVAGGRDAPVGWGLASWTFESRNGASWKTGTHSGDYWLSDWDFVPSKRDPGAYVIKAAGGPHAAVGAALSSWNCCGGTRNEASAWVYTHTGTHWPMDWKLYPCADSTCQWPESGRL